MTALAYSVRDFASSSTSPYAIMTSVNGNEQIGLGYKFVTGGAGTITVHIINYNTAKGAIYTWNMTAFSSGDLIHLGMPVNQSLGAGAKIKLYQNGVDLGAPSVFAYGGDQAWNYASTGDVRLANSAIVVLCNANIDNYKFHKYFKTDYFDRNRERAGMMTRKIFT